MPKMFISPAGQHASLRALSATVVGAAVVGSLYWAQSVLIPVAMAMFLAFLLTPLVRRLQRWRLGRKPSVILVVLFAVVLLSSFVWLLKVQLTNLAGELPAYTENVQAKVKDFHQLVRGVGMEGLGKMTQDISAEWEKALSLPATASSDAPGGTRTADPEVTTAVAASPESTAPAPLTVQESPEWLSGLSSFLSALMISFSGLAFSLVLVVFMLLEREALRNRVLRLAGNARMPATTKALDDAGGRISRYLLMQLAVNGSYGVSWGLGLFLIGVDFALLWAFLAALLRYIPYLGAPLAALLPITLSMAQFPGWWQPIAVIAFFLVLELVSNNVVEPWLYGQSIGVSPVAMLVAVAFWTFLWGPIGLVLSGPLTICLVVLGRHVPGLEIFNVLLGTEPALAADASYYQRLLARDQDEAGQLVSAQVKASSLESVYDTLLVPSLVYAKRDRAQDFVTEGDEQFIFEATREMLEDLGERQVATELTVRKTLPATEVQASPPRIRIMACPAGDHADRLALEMLRQLLDSGQWDVELTALETLTAELVAHVTEEKSTLICIGALPPGGLAHTRYLCKRLRARHPGLKILVGRWGLNENVDANRDQLQEAGADQIATTLLETRKQLNDWVPVLAYQDAKEAAT